MAAAAAERHRSRRVVGWGLRMASMDLSHHPGQLRDGALRAPCGRARSLPRAAGSLSRRSNKPSILRGPSLRRPAPRSAHRHAGEPLRSRESVGGSPFARRGKCAGEYENVRRSGGRPAARQWAAPARTASSPNSSIRPNEGGSGALPRVKDDVVRAGAGIGRYISRPGFSAESLSRRPDVWPPKRMITG